MMFKLFEVGDVVSINIPDDYDVRAKEIGYTKAAGLLSRMVYLNHESALITKVVRTDDDGFGIYKIDADDGNCVWDSIMLEAYGHYDESLFIDIELVTL